MTKIIIKIYRWLFAHSWAQRINHLLFECSLRGMGVLNFETAAVSGEDFLIRRYLGGRIKKDATIFDVGANVGQYSRSLRAHFPRARIIAFEPSPTTYLRLRETAGGHVECLNMGLSDSDTTLKLFDHSDGANCEHATLYEEVITGVHRSQSVAMDIRVRPLDDVAKEMGVERIDFLKIDTEGHELNVLKGAARYLSEGRIDVIQIEFNEMNRYSRCYFHDFERILPNYTIQRLLPNGFAKTPPRAIYQELFGFQNLLAIRKGWLREY